MTDTNQVEEAGSGSAKKRAMADHFLLDATGAVVEREEDATGIRYVDLATKETIDQQSGGVPGEALTMWANFGLKTLATNVASGMRQRGDDELQVQAIRDRFALNETGTWMDRTREVAPPDLEKLAEASTNVLVATKRIPAEKATRYRAGLLASFEKDPARVKTALVVDGVKAEYNRLIGKSVKTVDDLAAIAGIDD